MNCDRNGNANKAVAALSSRSSSALYRRKRSRPFPSDDGALSPPPSSASSPAAGLRIKPRAKPRRPLSAYALFFRREKEKIRSLESSSSSSSGDALLCDIIANKGRLVDDEAAAAGPEGQDAVQEGDASAQESCEECADAPDAASEADGKHRSAQKELARTISRRWRKLDESSRAIYDGLAILERKRYEREADAYERAKADEAERLYRRKGRGGGGGKRRRRRSSSSTSSLSSCSSSSSSSSSSGEENEGALEHEPQPLSEDEAQQRQRLQLQRPSLPKRKKSRRHENRLRRERAERKTASPPAAAVTAGKCPSLAPGSDPAFAAAAPRTQAQAMPTLPAMPPPPALLPQLMHSLPPVSVPMKALTPSPGPGSVLPAPFAAVGAAAALSPVAPPEAAAVSAAPAEPDMDDDEALSLLRSCLGSCAATPPPPGGVPPPSVSPFSCGSDNSGSGSQEEDEFRMHMDLYDPTPLKAGAALASASAVVVPNCAAAFGGFVAPVAAPVPVVKGKDEEKLDTECVNYLSSVFFSVVG